jgi:hemolysin type calcium-binding protein
MRLRALGLIVFLATALLGVLPWPASAAVPPTTLTFSFTGVAQTWEVPVGVTSASFDLYGAQGASTGSGGSLALGGLGAHVHVAAAVVPGETLTILVGGQDGTNGGGAVTTSGAGAGGGGSDVRRAGSGLGDRILVAGGGGGAGEPGFAGSPFAGGAGGGSAEDGGSIGPVGAGQGGQGATVDAEGDGGAGGARSCPPITRNGEAGSDGSLGSGGAGGSPQSSSFRGGGGGGGGGYYGGGGGGSGSGGCPTDPPVRDPGGGGGGGSSYTAPGATDVVTEEEVRSGAGVVTVTYIRPCTLSGDENNNKLVGSKAASDVLCGFGGNDTLTGLGGDDILLGGDGNDVLLGGKGDDYLDGEGDTDRVGYYDSGPTSGVTVNLASGSASGGLGNDTLLGIENVDGSPLADTITGTDVANVIDGRGGADSITGGDGNDVLIGSAGDDTTISGGLGDDRIQPGMGDDLAVSGGDGIDLLDYSAIRTGTGQTVNLAAPSSSGFAGTDAISTFESVYGTSGPDSLTAVLNGTASVVSGAGGDDPLLSVADTDTLDAVYGGPGGDTCFADATETNNC